MRWRTDGDADIEGSDDGEGEDNREGEVALGVADLACEGRHGVEPDEREENRRSRYTTTVRASGIHDDTEGIEDTQRHSRHQKYTKEGEGGE